jgi:hypothetical protein
VANNVYVLLGFRERRSCTGDAPNYGINSRGFPCDCRSNNANDDPDVGAKGVEPETYGQDLATIAHGLKAASPDIHVRESRKTKPLVSRGHRTGGKQRQSVPVWHHSIALALVAILSCVIAGRFGMSATVSANFRARLRVGTEEVAAPMMDSYGPAIVDQGAPVIRPDILGRMARVLRNTRLSRRRHRTDSTGTT